MQGRLMFKSITLAITFGIHEGTVW
uniref:Uncharacterized protein n=1 Tax=Arundo donax TaxID=35708 RepID=A0A0A9ER45_ARUDO